MCVVYEAEHAGLRQALALKMLKPELARVANCVERFEREARAVAQLRSANVAKVFDVDYLPTGEPYITMELLVGHDLGCELRAVGRLPVHVAVDYVRQACSGIAEAHALGIVHRDLKPENLFLADLGNQTGRKLVKILDFGIAKDSTERTSRLTVPGVVFGTVDYMSPEQVRAASNVDPRSDIWSLGVILYELLTGRPPYLGNPRAVLAKIATEPISLPRKQLADVPQPLVAVLMRMLEKDPDKRFQSAEAVRAALEPFGDGEPITSVMARLPPQTIPRRGTSLPPRSRDAASEAAETLWEARTHAAWATGSERTTRGKTWMFAASILLLLCGAAALGFLGSRRLLWSSQAVSASVDPDLHARSRPTPNVRSASSATPASPMPTNAEPDGGAAITWMAPKAPKSRRQPAATSPPRPGTKSPAAGARPTKSSSQ